MTGLLAVFSLAGVSSSTTNIPGVGGSGFFLTGSALGAELMAFEKLCLVILTSESPAMMPRLATAMASAVSKGFLLGLLGAFPPRPF